MLEVPRSFKEVQDKASSEFGAGGRPKSTYGRQAGTPRAHHAVNVGKLTVLTDLKPTHDAADLQSKAKHVIARMQHRHADGCA